MLIITSQEVGKVYYLFLAPKCLLALRPLNPFLTNLKFLIIVIK